jgi:hypothetical protein
MSVSLRRVSDQQGYGFGGMFAAKQLSPGHQQKAETAKIAISFFSPFMLLPFP